jgi:hypothetical protein
MLAGFNRWVCDAEGQLIAVPDSVCWFYWWAVPDGAAFAFYRPSKELTGLIARSEVQTGICGCPICREGADAICHLAEVCGDERAPLSAPHLTSLSVVMPARQGTAPSGQKRSSMAIQV